MIFYKIKIYVHLWIKFQSLSRFLNLQMPVFSCLFKCDSNLNDWSQSLQLKFFSPECIAILCFLKLAFDTYRFPHSRHFTFLLRVSECLFFWCKFKSDWDVNILPQVRHWWLRLLAWVWIWFNRSSFWSNFSLQKMHVHFFWVVRLVLEIKKN